MTDPSDELILDAPWDAFIHTIPANQLPDLLPPPATFRNHNQENT